MCCYNDPLTKIVKPFDVLISLPLDSNTILDPGVPSIDINDFKKFGNDPGTLESKTSGIKSELESLVKSE